MQRAHAHSFSRRVQNSIGLLLCACIAASTLISTSFAAAGTMTMSSEPYQEASSHQHKNEVMTHHGEVDTSTIGHELSRTSTAHNTQHLQHDTPCDNSDHQGKSNCPESCTTKLCCTAGGLPGLFNTLQLNTPTFTEHYFIHFASQLQSQQPSLVLRPPIA